MGKVLMITGLLYLLYYAGNIAYDLFIKKTAIVNNGNEGEVISLGSITDEIPADITTVSVEEAENLNMPDSYILSDDDELFSDADIEPWPDRVRFEEEREIDRYNVEQEPTADEKKEQGSFLSKLSSALNIEEKDIISKETEIIPTTISDEMFKNFFDKASSHIVVGQTSGQNFYRSSLVF